MGHKSDPVSQNWHFAGRMSTVTPTVSHPSALFNTKTPHIPDPVCENDMFLPCFRLVFTRFCPFQIFSRPYRKARHPDGVLSLTENTQRYKSLLGFAIFSSGAIFACGKRYVLRGVRGFISYRAEHSEAYRNRVKRGYIAFA